jgi:hypothetical protein
MTIYGGNGHHMLVTRAFHAVAPRLTASSAGGPLIGSIVCEVHSAERISPDVPKRLLAVPAIYRSSFLFCNSIGTCCAAGIIGITAHNNASARVRDYMLR